MAAFTNDFSDPETGTVKHGIQSGTRTPKNRENEEENHGGDIEKGHVALEIQVPTSETTQKKGFSK